MSPPDLSPFWKVLDHIRSKYLHAKEVALSRGDSTRTLPPRQWCLEYCTARARGAEVGYVDESCLCGYEKEDLKREAGTRHVKKRSLEKRQSRSGNPFDRASSSDPSNTGLEQPTSSIQVATATSPTASTNTAAGIPSVSVDPVASQPTQPIPTTIAIETATSSPTSSSSNGGLSSGAKIGLGVGIGVGVAAIIASIALLCLCRRRRNNKTQTKYLPQQQSDLSMVEATQPVPRSRAIEAEPLTNQHIQTSKPTYNSYEIYEPPQRQHQHQHQQYSYEPPPPFHDVFQTPVSAITPQDSYHQETPVSPAQQHQHQHPLSSPTLVIPDRAPSPTHEEGHSPVSPVSPVSALSSRPGSLKHQTGR